MANEYRLLSYVGADGSTTCGVLVGDRVYPAREFLGEARHGLDYTSVIGLLNDWGTAHARLHEAAQTPSSAPSIPLSEARLFTPIIYPSALFCAGANYWDHADEMNARTGQKPPAPGAPRHRARDPWFFIKTSRHSIVAPDATVNLPNGAKNVDWEAELGVVIGTRTKGTTVARALDAVAGYVCFNDLSARDLGNVPDRAGTAFASNWLAHKSWEGSAPIGPWLTPAAYVPDPQNLWIKLWINGVLKQDSNTGHMIHNIAEQIECLSRNLTLRPGDIVATGTPAGTGAGRGEFLKPGDEIRIEIEKCGTLVTHIAR